VRVTDPRLAVLAKQAGVRPPHVFWVIHYRAALKDHFDPDLCAEAAQLEPRHVLRILELLGDPVQRKPRHTTAAHGLSEGWAMPEDWLVEGRTRRFWSMDVCRTEADNFYQWHRMKGTRYSDWKAAWINWVKRSHRENGNASAPGQSSFESEEARKAYLQKLG
jgi:hypothetical protein